MGAFSNEEKTTMTYATMKVVAEKDNTGKEFKHPYFIIKHKVDGKYIERERFKNFTATPYAIELGSYKYEGNDIDTVKIKFFKDGERIQLEFNLDNGLSRNLINTMLGSGAIGELAMSVYNNKDGYPSISINNDGQRGEWKYKHDQFPPVEKNKKGVVIDNDAYLAFLRQMVEEVKKKLPGQEPAWMGGGKITPNLNEERQVVAGKVTDDHSASNDLPF